MAGDISLKLDVSIKNLMETVTQISKWQRYSGSKEELEAFEYLEEILSGMGYETTLMKHDAFISLPVCSKLLVNGEEVCSQTHSMSPSTDKAGVEGYGVYIKYPEEDFSYEKCMDKIAVIDGMAGYLPAKRAYDAGARGIVFIAEDMIREFIVSAAWGSPSVKTKALLPRIPVVSVAGKPGDAIKALLEKSTARMNIFTEVDTGWRKIPSLTAEIKAPVKTDKFVMFTGHLDSWYYGAIDNGTVNAAQVEIARIIAKNKAALLRNFKVVFFSGHSHGRYAGSAWYSDEYWEELHKNCIININADSIGGKNAIDITRSIIMPEAKDIAVKIIREITGIDFVGRRCKKVADQSFWNAGVTSAFASFSKQPLVPQPDGTVKVEKGNAELGWWWHTPNDTLENIDPENFIRDARVFAAYVIEFLTAKIIPLNFLRSAEEIRTFISIWTDKAGKRFDLASSLKKSDQLVPLCMKLYEAEITDPDRFNDTVMKLGRFLVPLNFTTGNIYENDPAEDLPPIPSLSLIDRLVLLEDGGEEAMEMIVELMHKRNFVNDSLDKAIELIRNYLAL